MSRPQSASVTFPFQSSRVAIHNTTGSWMYDKYARFTMGHPMGQYTDAGQRMRHNLERIQRAQQLREYAESKRRESENFEGYRQKVEKTRTEHEKRIAKNPSSSKQRAAKESSKSPDPPKSQGTPP